MVCMLRFRGRHAGVAQTARGPDLRRMVSTSDRQSLAFLAARTRAVQNGIRLHPARAWSRVQDPGAPGRRRMNATPVPHPQDGPPQARFHPRPGCRPAQAGTGGKDFSGGWLGPPPFLSVEAASGTRRCTCLLLRPAARYDSHPEAFPPPGPARFRHIRWRERHECDTRGGMRGKDCRVFRVYNWNRLGVGQVLCTRRRRFLRNPISPLAGEMSAKQTEGGVFPLVSSARILGRLHPPLSPTVTSPPQGGRLEELSRPVRLPTE